MSQLSNSPLPKSKSLEPCFECSATGSVVSGLTAVYVMFMARKTTHPRSRTMIRAVGGLLGCYSVWNAVEAWRLWHTENKSDAQQTNR